VDDVVVELEETESVLVDEDAESPSVVELDPVESGARVDADVVDMDVVVVEGDSDVDGDDNGCNSVDADSVRSPAEGWELSPDLPPFFFRADSIASLEFSGTSLVTVIISPANS
jgi:hypothetical protein